MNRVSAIINPATGTGFNVVNQAYEAASRSKRAQSWGAVDIAPNAALAGYLSSLRRQSRSAYRNNPYISSGIDNKVATEVGTGITVRSMASDEKFRTAANALLKEFFNDIDPQGQLNLQGQQAQCSRNRRVSGEVFIRRRRRALSAGHVLPFQCEVLESDFVPETMHRTLSNGNVVISGIEFNKRRQRVAYYMYMFHPGERNQSAYNKLVRVPARDVIHHYLPTRPGQVRGEPDTVQSLVKANTFDQYDDAELVRKQQRAKFTGFLTRDAQYEDGKMLDPFTGRPFEDEDGMMGANIEAGTIIQGLPGESLEMFASDDPGNNYSDFMRWQCLSKAKGLGVPYEILTGDWKDVSDRVMRVVLHEYRRQIEMDCDHLMIFQVCRKIYHWAIDAAILVGKLPVGNYLSERTDLLKHEWRPQGHPYMHPEQDINAKTKGITNGLFSVKDTVAKQGQDIDANMEENLQHELRWHQRREELNLPAAQYPLAVPIETSEPNSQTQE